MAQPNPTNPTTQGSSFSASTGASDVPNYADTGFGAGTAGGVGSSGVGGTTGSTNGSTGTTAGTTAGTGVVDTRSTGQKIRDAIGGGTHSTTSTTHHAGSGIKVVLAGIHGAGETLRGEFNAAIDRAFGETAGEAKNENIARQGEQELNTGHFSTGTKAREGVIPGDGVTR